MVKETRSNGIGMDVLSTAVWRDVPSPMARNSMSYIEGMEGRDSFEEELAAATRELELDQTQTALSGRPDLPIKHDGIHTDNANKDGALHEEKRHDGTTVREPLHSHVVYNEDDSTKLATSLQAKSHSARDEDVKRSPPLRDRSRRMTGTGGRRLSNQVLLEDSNGGQEGQNRAALSLGTQNKIASMMMEAPKVISQRRLSGLPGEETHLHPRRHSLLSNPDHRPSQSSSVSFPSQQRSSEVLGSIPRTSSISGERLSNLSSSGRQSSSSQIGGEAASSSGLLGSSRRLRSTNDECERNKITVGAHEQSGRQSSHTETDASIERASKKSLLGLSSQPGLEESDNFAGRETEGLLRGSAKEESSLKCLRNRPPSTSCSSSCSLGSVSSPPSSAPSSPLSSSVSSDLQHSSQVASTGSGLDLELPRALWEAAPNAADKNMQYGTYTAVHTKNPITFTSDGYLLRPARDGVRIKCLVCCTAYNEGEKDFRRTIAAVNENIRSLMKIEGNDAWKSVYVIIVSDGRAKADKDTLDMLQADLGLFDESVMITFGDGSEKDVHMHLFQHTTQLLDDPNHQTYHPPMQLCHALKERNGGKLHSHLWFFNAFAEQLDPKYCFLLDIGTKPSKRALIKLYLEMENDPQVSHVLDKALESCFGFITVLPGAFSAYRYCAIREENGEGPLVEYFRSITTEMRELGPFKGNMFLAEDRVLCYELIARTDCNWTLSYVKNSVAETDIPEDLTTLIHQRRRWLNGSFFALLYAISNFNRLFTRSNHSFVRLSFFCFQFLYLVLTSIAAFTIVGHFFIFYYLIIDATFEGENEILKEAFIGIYMFLLLQIVIMSLGNKPDHMKEIFAILMVLFSVLSVLTLSLTVYHVIYRSSLSVQIAAFVSFVFYFLAGALHGEALPMLLSTLQYFVMLPTTINILSIYAFCNTHDLSWGTKGIRENEEHESWLLDRKLNNGLATPAELKYAAKIRERHQKKQEKREQEQRDTLASFENFRTHLLSAFLLVNALLAAVVTSYAEGSSSAREVYLMIMFGLVCFFNGLRFFGSVFYMFGYTIRRHCGCLRLCCCGSKHKHVYKNRYKYTQKQVMQATASSSSKMPSRPHVPSYDPSGESASDKTKLKCSQSGDISIDLASLDSLRTNRSGVQIVNSGATPSSDAYRSFITPESREGLLPGSVSHL